MAPRNGSGKSSYPLAHEARFNRNEIERGMVPQDYLAAYQRDCFEHTQAQVPPEADTWMLTPDSLAVVFYKKNYGNVNGGRPVSRKYRGKWVTLTPHMECGDPLLEIH